MRFVRVTLEAPAERVPAVHGFYRDTLGLAPAAAQPGASAVAIGETVLELVPAGGEPFYHLALLVPGNRFDAALTWARERTQLLPGEDAGDPVFDFSFWNARAVYFHDPAGSIVELIAHRGVAESERDGPFDPGEVAGISELGLVGDPAPMARALATLGLEVWDGSAEQPRGLAFVGERARTLILGRPGRGWLPTGRPAEPYRVEAVLDGPPFGAVELEGGLHRIARGAPHVQADPIS